MAIPKKVYLQSFVDWEKRWHKCTVSQGEFFEGNGIDLLD